MCKIRTTSQVKLKFKLLLYNVKSISVSRIKMSKIIRLYSWSITIDFLIRLQFSIYLPVLFIAWQNPTDQIQWRLSRKILAAKLGKGGLESGQWFESKFKRFWCSYIHKICPYMSKVSGTLSKSNNLLLLLPWLNPSNQSLSLEAE
jgi:hypothetical protein